MIFHRQSHLCSTPCATDEHLIEGTNSCATTASDGYFIDANDNTIKKCHSRCSTCSAAPSNDTIALPALWDISPYHQNLDNVTQLMI